MATYTAEIWDTQLLGRKLTNVTFSPHKSFGENPAHEVLVDLAKGAASSKGIRNIWALSVKNIKEMQ